MYTRGLKPAVPVPVARANALTVDAPMPDVAPVKIATGEEGRVEVEREAFEARIWERVTIALAMCDVLTRR